MSPRFPFEICERIVDELEAPLHSSNPFYSCCLVSRAWLPRARYRLYQEPIVYLNAITTFSKCLSYHPANGIFVHHLYLSGWDSDYVSEHHELSLLPVLLPDRLPRLSHLTLDGIQIGRLHPTFFPYMRRFQAVKKLTCIQVEVASPNLFNHLLRSLHHLELLEAIDVRISPPAGWDSLTSNIPDHAAAKLRHKVQILNVMLENGDFPGGYEPFNPCSVLSLRLHCGKGSISTVQYLFQHFHTLPSVTHLSLHFIPGLNPILVQSLSRPLHMPKLTHLEAYITWSNDFEGTIFESSCNILSKIIAESLADVSVQVLINEDLEPRSKAAVALRTIDTALVQSPFIGIRRRSVQVYDHARQPLSELSLRVLFPRLGRLSRTNVHFPAKLYSSVRISTAIFYVALITKAAVGKDEPHASKVGMSCFVEA